MSETETERGEEKKGEVTKRGGQREICTHTHRDRERGERVRQKDRDREKRGNQE